MSATRTELRAGGIGFAQNLAIGLDSTAPAYSLAAVLGVLAAGVGLQVPAVLLLAFVPIFLTSLGYRALNRVEPDCGTTYRWVTRGLGRHAGWVAGFVVTVTSIVVVGSLADVAATYGLDLVGWEAAAESDLAVVLLAVAVIAAMAGVAAAGIEVSARMQAVLASFQFAGLGLFAAAALLAEGGPTPAADWLNPFAIPIDALPAALVVAVFVYWGWESTTSVNEETEHPRTAPGRAAVVSTVLLLATYVLVAVGALSRLGPGAAEFEDDVAILGNVADQTLPAGLAWIVLAAVVVSALATTHTTILPASRTALSMARRGALPRVFADVSGRTRTPVRGTLLLAAISVAWYVPARLLDEDFLADTITGLGLLIALYYGLTALAAPLVAGRRGGRSMLAEALLPTLGALLMFAIFVLAIPEFAADGGVPLMGGIALLAVAALGALWGARHTREPHANHH